MCILAGLNKGGQKELQEKEQRKKNCLDSLGLTSSDHLGYVWFLVKFEGKCKGKKKWRKIKNGLKVDKLFLFFTSNSFYLF